MSSVKNLTLKTNLFQRHTRKRKNRVSLRQNFTTMKIKTYNTKEEARAAFRRSIEMRAEYEAKVRQKWEEMKSSINPSNAPAAQQLLPVPS